MILLDTNVLGRLTAPADPRCGVARQAIATLFKANERLVIVPQNLYEFWAVATRRPGSPPAGQNGLGMSARQAGQWLDFFRRRFVLLPDRPELTSVWQTLVQKLNIRGFRAHDARLVVAMQTYGIRKLLTFNHPDFASLPVETLDPASV